MIKSLIIILSFVFVVDVFAMDTANTKNTILEEFKKKLSQEEELQQELKKNKTLTNEDLEGLIEQDKVTIKDLLDANKQNEAEKAMEEELKKQKKKELEEMKKRVEQEQKRREKEEERIRKENEKIAEEEKKLKEEQEKLKKEEELLNKTQQNKELKEKIEKSKSALKAKLDELLKRKSKLEEDTNALIEEVNEKIDNTLKANDTTNQNNIQVEKSGVLNKIFNITDTGVSEEFLYTDEYKNLVTNQTNISKVDVNKESDIPVIGIQEKNLVNFDTSDIPQELLAYKRTEQNKHIPTIMSNKDFQQIAISAVEENNLAVLRGVVEQTKDPDFLVDNNRTLLSLAIGAKNYLLSRYLIYSGASINRVDKNKNNPLHISVINYSKDISDLLMENGVDINAQNKDGNTPLMLAILTNQDDLVVDLLKNGADIHIKNLNGDDAMSLSVKNNKRKIQQYLKEIIRTEEYNKK